MSIRSLLSLRPGHALLGSLLLLCGCSDSDDGDQTAGPPADTVCQPASRSTDILLVHGAFADGSSWSRVIQELQDDGFTVHAVQLREQSLADDAANVRHAIGKVERPLVVVGHSYGGTVITESAGGASNVKALVYVAAFAPAPGETTAKLASGYPGTAAFEHLVIDDKGNATIEPGAFVSYFATDLPASEARALAVVQRPTAASILVEPSTAAAWETVPSYYQVSANDQVINPDLQRFFAARMKATTIELASSHVSLLSHAREVADLVERAASVTPRQCP